MLYSSVIRQKGESRNGGNKRAKHAKFSEKRTFLTSWYAHLRTCAYHGVRNVRFSENLACFAFMLLRFEIRPFVLLPTYLQWRTRRWCFRLLWIDWIIPSKSLWDIHIDVPSYSRDIWGITLTLPIFVNINFVIVTLLILKRCSKHLFKVNHRSIF